ncbi:uncharacterized protein [Nicotiana sylvestris]|uniref:uncharacterized protein n=1 Tax=Nicotiana sylvestris TaxID=4096 RepID=UPI00388C9C1D
MVDGGSSVDVFPLSTLQRMKINTDKIQPINVRIRAFNGSARDTIGEMNLTLTIGPIYFEIVFQVVDMVTSYNFLLGRPWIHTARAVPSTLHQMLKFEHDKQEIIEGCESIVNQAFEVVVVDHVKEGKPILHPRIFATSIMVAAVMLRQGYEPGKGLGASLQGISEPNYPFSNQGTFGLGFRPTQADKPSTAKSMNGSCNNLSLTFFTLLSSHDSKRAGEGTSPADMQLIDPDIMLTNWEATPLPTRKESCFVNADFNNMTCMRNSCPDLKKLSDIEIMYQEIEYDEDEIVEEINRELEQFENKPKPNLMKLSQLISEVMKKVMPFGLKNARATYMRAMTTILHDMTHKEIEEYIDDVIIKSKTQANHVCDLKNFLERLQRFDLKLNTAKFTFGVPSGKLLGFIVSQRSIELDPSKLTTTCEPIFKLLKKDVTIKWTNDCQKTFDRIKDYLSKPPVLVPPELGRPLFLYVSVMDNSFGCVLGQHDATSKKEQTIYYLSKKFTNFEVKMDPLKYIFQKPMPTGRLAKWQILLIKFDIIYVTCTAMKAQALADHLAENLVDDKYKPLSTYFLDKEVNSIEEVVPDDHPV